MDLRLCAIASVIETIALTGLRQSIQQLRQSRNDLVLGTLGLFLLQYVVLKFYRTIIYPHFVSPMRHMPGPKDNTPLLGQMLNLISAKSPREHYVRWANTWPEAPFVRFLMFGNQETLVINSPEASREVFQTHCYSFKKPDLFWRFVEDSAGRGLLFAEGDEHKRQRGVLNSMFTVANLRGIVPLFQEKAGEMTQYFEKLMGGERKATLEIQYPIFQLALDLVGVTTLGVELNNITSSTLDMDFLKCYERMFSQSTLSSIISFINLYIPVRNILPIEANYGYVRAGRELRKMMRAMIRQRVQDLDEAARTGKPFVSSKPSAGGRDMLTLLLQEQKRLKGGDTDGVLSEEEIMNMMMNFLAAGHETSAGAITWIVFVLATKPEAQDKLRSEVSAFLKKHPTPNYNEIESFQYLNIFVMESLRVFAPNLLSYREAAHDITVCGQFIPKGTPLVAAPSVTNLQEAVWGPDAAEFRPERWLENSDPSSATRNPYAFATFSFGRRVCIGKNYSILQIKVMLMELVTKFRIEMSDELAVAVKRGDGEPGLPALQNPTVTFRPKGGLKVVLERI